MPTKQIYVGYTSDCLKRWNEHESGNSDARLFNRFFRKHSNLNEWTRSVLFECEDKEEALRLEGVRTRYLVKCGKKLGRQLLNLKHGGYGVVGYSHTEETKKTISATLKGRTPWNKGGKLSEEHRRRQSESHMGRVSPNKGKKMSEEQKKKISEGVRRRLDESRVKQGNSLQTT